MLFVGCQMNYWNPADLFILYLWQFWSRFLSSSVRVTNNWWYHSGIDLYFWNFVLLSPCSSSKEITARLELFKFTSHTRRSSRQHIYWNYVFFSVFENSLSTLKLKNKNVVSVTNSTAQTRKATEEKAKKFS